MTQKTIITKWHSLVLLDYSQEFDSNNPKFMLENNYFVVGTRVIELVKSYLAYRTFTKCEISSAHIRGRGVPLESSGKYTF